MSVFVSQPTILSGCCSTPADILKTAPSLHRQHHPPPTPPSSILMLLFFSGSLCVLWTTVKVSASSMSKHCNTARCTGFEVKSLNNVSQKCLFSIIETNSYACFNCNLVINTVLSVVLFMYCKKITVMENLLCLWLIIYVPHVIVVNNTRTD